MSSLYDKRQRPLFNNTSYDGSDMILGRFQIYEALGDLDFSCGRTDGRTKVLQEVLADLKKRTISKGYTLYTGLKKPAWQWLEAHIALQKETSDCTTLQSASTSPIEDAGLCGSTNHLHPCLLVVQ